VITAGLVVAALATCAGAGLLPLLLPLRWVGIRTVAYLALAAATVLLTIAGIRGLTGSRGAVELGTFFGFGETSLVVDPLAGLFLAVVGLVGTPVMLGFAAWSRNAADSPFRWLPSAVGLTMIGIVAVLLADSAFVFLFGWETVSVGFYLLTGYHRNRPGRPRAAMLAFAFSKVSGALLLLSFLSLAGATGSFHLADWSAAHGAVHTVAYLLALTGFTAKVGVVPLQVWIPTGYAAAPGPARALMSAVAADIGFYGMWRTLQILGRPPLWLVVILLLAASFTALLGIAHASVQRDLQRVIAYSSVENGGLITAGYAVALAGAVVGSQRLIALGLLTATLQMLAHGLAKSGLFLATARIEQVTGETDLDRLIGSGRREPVVGVSFAVGAFTLAALPLTLGFVSEWFLLESIMQLFRLPQLTLQLTLAAAGALLALAAGYAGFTFVRLVGLTVLGTPSARPVTGSPAGLGPLGRLALVLPALGSVALAAVSPWVIGLISRGLAGIVPSAVTQGALASPWVLQPVFADFSALSPSWLAVELPVLGLVLLGLSAALTRRSMFRVRRVPAWRSATGGVAGDAQYTPFAFANPTRHVLGNLLLTRSGRVEVERETHHDEDLGSAFSGPDLPGNGGSAGDGHAPPLDGHHVAYTTDVVELVERFLYQPLLGPTQRLVGAAKRLQSGRLDAYVAYMLVALIALLAVVVALS
jgi:hydrogenase-4 component B